MSECEERARAVLNQVRTAAIDIDGLPMYVPPHLRQKLKEWATLQCHIAAALVEIGRAVDAVAEAVEHG